VGAYTSKATGNWDTEGQAVWNEAGHPTAADAVTIQNGHTITLDSATSCTTLIIDAGGVLTDATNNQGLTVSGKTEVSGTLTCGTAAMSFASGHTGSYGLEILAGATFVGGSGNHTMGSFGFIECTATLTSGITEIDSYWDWGSDYSIVFNGCTFDDGDGTITFTHADHEQPMWSSANVARTFYNFIVNKAAGTVKFGSALGFTLTIANDFTITSGIFNTETQNNLDHDIIVTGNTSITGTMICNDSTTITFNGNLTINNGGTLTSTTGTTNIGGDFDNGNGGTFTNSSGSVVFTGTTQAVDGSTTWHNLDKHVAAADTFTIDNTSTQTVAGALNLYGASGQLLSILSDSAGVAFNLTLTGTKGTMQYLSVKDSDASGSDADVKPIAPTNSTDVSGNTDWFTDFIPQVIIIT